MQQKGRHRMSSAPSPYLYLSIVLSIGCVAGFVVTCKGIYRACDIRSEWMLFGGWFVSGCCGVALVYLVVSGQSGFFG